MRTLATCCSLLGLASCVVHDPHLEGESGRPAADEIALAAGVPIPERLLTGDTMDLDRSGDLRPEARALLDAIDSSTGPVTDPFADSEEPRAFTPPEEIRVWRRRLDGSATSCSGRVDVIPFEQYGRGVLPHEWIASWHMESLKAGAVAVRTYAAWWVRRGGKYECADLDDTSRSQVYKDEFHQRTDRAIAATEGVFVVQDGKLVLAEYSAENSDPTKFGVEEPYCTDRAQHGHGRGTCQRGSQRWANLAEKPFDWIVTHYYPGSELSYPDVEEDPDDRDDDADDGAGPAPVGDDDPVVAGCSATGRSKGWAAAAGVLIGAALSRRRRSARRGDRA